MIVEEARYPSIKSVRKLIRQVFEVRGKLSEIGCQTDVDIENGRGGERHDGLCGGVDGFEGRLNVATADTDRVALRNFVGR
jgi:hypothetical protein